MPTLIDQKKEQRLERYLRIRRQTEYICEPLEKEDYVVQPIADVSPPKWHLGHTSWFFETFLLKPLLNGYKIFNPDFNYVFNSYYESVGARVLRTNRGNLTRPSVNEVKSYRAYIDAHMARLMDTLQDEDRVRFNTFFEIGLQHEQQHQELLVTDIKYILGTNPLWPAYQERHSTSINTAADSEKAAYLEVPGGLYNIGYDGNDFAWDNEKPVHACYVQDFRMRDRLVSNREYLEFIADGGYADFRYWLAEGWDWVKKEQWQAPLYWHQIEGEWYHYTLHGLEKLDLQAPVTHISFYEADAYATWAGKRLPTEQEWEVFAQQYANQQGNFLESGGLHPTAAGESNRSEHGAYQVLGDCWEWTYSGYFPYPGYRRAEGALGEYNGKFMIGQMVLRGGSCATPASHIRSTYRNFFHPDKRWQFTGIRLAE